MSGYKIDIFSTSPQSADIPSEHYIEQIRNVAKWSEECGCSGILVYADNRLVDPWMVSQVIIEHTEQISPLVAVQPVYMHPYTVANMITSFGYMYGRKIYLNMVAGGFKNDLKALNDETPHDARYDRLSEYTAIISDLLRGNKPVSFNGDYYQVHQLSLKPALNKELLPGIFISGSSEAGIQAARNLHATAIQYPQPPEKYSENLNEDSLNYGIRIGIIAREDPEYAWKIAYERFPADRTGQLAHKLAMKTSDSVWHKNLTDLSDKINGEASVYWLHPFENYKTFCPYLVGSYDQIAGLLANYIEIGYRTFILDIPPDKEELIHTKQAFDKALKLVTE